MTDNLQPNQNQPYNPMQPNQFVAFMRRIWPRVVRILNTIIYTIFDFIRSGIKYIIDQIKNYD